MKKTPLFTCLVLLVAAPSVASPSSGGGPLADVVVIPTEVTNLSPGQGEAVAALIAQAYERATRARVLRASELNGEDPAYVANEIIDVRVIALETKIVVSATRRRRSGEPIHS